MSIRLKEMRDRLGYSQEGMAKPIGMTQTTYAGWEKQPPEIFERLARFASHYAVSADYLLGIIDDPAGRRGLAPDEMEALHLWEALDDGQRQLVVDTMKALQRASTPRIVGEED